RKSIRLKGYDYSQPGLYFVTICAFARKCLFGTVVDGVMRVNEAGNIIDECWDDLPNHYPNVELDEFGVMPNHVHGIVALVEPAAGGSETPPTKSQAPLFEIM